MRYLYMIEEVCGSNSRLICVCGSEERAEQFIVDSDPDNKDNYRIVPIEYYED